MNILRAATDAQEGAKENKASLMVHCLWWIPPKGFASALRQRISVKGTV